MLEVEYLKELNKSTEERVERSLELIKIDKGNIAYIYESIEFEFKTIGIVEFKLNSLVSEAKKNFYKSTLARKWIYWAYESQNFEIEKESVSTYVYESLFYAVLSGCKERYIHMANLFGGRAKEESDDYLSNILLGYGLKYVILDDKEKSYEYINKLIDNKEKRGMKQYYNGEVRVFIGLINRDEEEFNEGLKFLLKNHKARMKKNGNTLEQYFAYNSLAYAMLAKERGIEIKVTHELLPLEFLEETEINYSELTIFN